MEATIKTRENRVRRQLAKRGYRLKKSRSSGCCYVNGTYQGLNANDYGGYMIVQDGIIQTGERFDLTLEDVERFAAE